MDSVLISMDMEKLVTVGLSRRTYGGTPIIGLRSEAPLYGPVFCQSCDDDL